MKTDVSGAIMEPGMQPGSGVLRGAARADARSEACPTSRRFPPANAAWLVAGLAAFAISCLIGCVGRTSGSQKAQAQSIARARRPARWQATEAAPPPPRRQAIRAETPTEEAARLKQQAATAASAQDVGGQQFVTPPATGKQAGLVSPDTDVGVKPVALVKEAPPSLVEKYLHSGELAKGEQALEAALAAQPADDQLRFGLGVLRFVRGVERFGQSLYQYGAMSENTNAPFLRLPVPRNPEPATIRYWNFRRILDDFHRDLAAAEETLAGVKDEHVKLPLRLAAVRLDLDGDGKPTDVFADLMKKIMQQNFAFPKTNPEFLVCFDRGDVAWLRAYCHLLMGMLDFYLAFDTEPWFDEWAGRVFAKPRTRDLTPYGLKDKIAVMEPVRLGRFRRHVLKVAELNRETWKYIRAETDDDHEWLPNPRQKGVLGMPVRDEMIDAWLDAVAEVESVLNGTRLLFPLFGPTNGKGLNLRKLLDDPPAEFHLSRLPDGLPDKYLEAGSYVDFSRILRVFQVFGNTTAVAYAAYFN